MLRKTWRMQENVSKKATPHLMYTHATTYTDHGTFNLETSESSVNASESVVLSIYFIMSMYLCLCTCICVRVVMETSRA